MAPIWQIQNKMLSDRYQNVMKLEFCRKNYIFKRQIRSNMKYYIKIRKIVTISSTIISTIIAK